MTLHVNQLGPLESSVIRLMRHDKKFQMMTQQIMEHYAFSKIGEPSLDTLLESMTGIAVIPVDEEGHDSDG